MRLILSLLLLLSVPLASASSVVVNGLRAWPAPDHTRVVFDLEAALAGMRLEDIDSTIEKFFAETAIEMLSVTGDDFAASINDAVAKHEGV